MCQQSLHKEVFGPISMIKDTILIDQYLQTIILRINGELDFHTQKIIDLRPSLVIIVLYSEQVKRCVIGFENANAF